MLLASPVLPISKDRSLVIGLTDFTMQVVNVAQTLMAKKDSDPWPQWNFTCLVKVTTETILQTWPNSNHFLTISLPNIPTTVATAGSTVWKAVSSEVERPKTSQIITVRNSIDVTNVSRVDRIKFTATNPNKYRPSFSEDIFVLLALIRFIWNTPCCGAAAHSPRKVTVSAYNCQSQLSTHTPWAIKFRVQRSFCFWGYFRASRNIRKQRKGFRWLYE